MCATRVDVDILRNRIVVDCKTIRNTPGIHQHIRSPCNSGLMHPHEFDECRFDVSVNDCVWYLRGETPEEKQRWVEILESYKASFAPDFNGVLLLTCNETLWTCTVHSSKNGSSSQRFYYSSAHRDYASKAQSSTVCPLDGYTCMLRRLFISKLVCDFTVSKKLCDRHPSSPVNYPSQ
ncbi:hypothetical protein PR048_020546 [Dryococelus australis]|uniref:PH domain-containing protein n=1 Tax=Dryococelus australis TaxID=614101 RepID=A0ABQ9H6R0_9NEOP|nr:hypothetical protein PR048_020546 [Dryococelus australis]